MTDRKKKYEDKRVTKRVSFNINNNQDLKRLEFIKDIDFSNFTKRMIDDEIHKNKSLVATIEMIDNV